MSAGASIHARNLRNAAALDGLEALLSAGASIHAGNLRNAAALDGLEVLLSAGASFHAGDFANAATHHVNSTFAAALYKKISRISRKPTRRSVQTNERM